MVRHACAGGCSARRRPGRRLYGSSRRSGGNHTEGSVCLHLPEHALLLAGDTLFAGSVGRTDLPGGDMRTLLRSIHNRLLTLPDATVVIPGHGKSTSIEREREGSPFV